MILMFYFYLHKKYLTICHYLADGNLPQRIFIYRDGVGDGQIPYVHSHEVGQSSYTLRTYIFIYKGRKQK